MRLRSRYFLLLASLMTHPAFAQATSNATAEADDAFGYSVGDDAVGIYDPASVRGFDLEAAGNYRINGYYFVKSSGVSNFFVASTAVRIGSNTFGLTFPGPSGVVDYRLRDPAPGERSLLTVGVNGDMLPYADFNIRHRSSDDAVSGSLGLGVVIPSRDFQGARNSSWIVAGTTMARLGDAGSVQIYAGEYEYAAQSSVRLGLTEGRLPPRVVRVRYLGQEWADSRGESRIAGGIVEYALSEKLRLGAIATVSQDDPTRSFSQFFTDFADDGSARSTVIASPHQRSTAWSGEGRLTWEGRTGRIAHRLALSARLRRSRATFGGDAVVDLGRVDLSDIPQAASVNPGSRVADLRTKVDQEGMGLSWLASLGQDLRVNLGVLKTRYEKTFAAPGVRTTNRSDPLLYNVGLLVRVAKPVELYASYSRGLEEAGTAPAYAANRNAVLDAILVRQVELGMRYALGAGLSAIVAGFETRKPYAGLDPVSGVYGLRGTVRHRGIEGSLSGRLAPGLSVVLGGVYLDPTVDDRSGAPGARAMRPVGVPTWQGVASASYEVPGASGIGLDLAARMVGPQAATASAGAGGSQTLVPADGVVDAGVRYTTNLAGRPTSFRLQLLNLTNAYGWTVDGSETLAYYAPRRVRVAATMEF